MKKKNIIKIIILVIVVILLVFLGILLYKQLMINKFKNLLEENDSTNYELVQTDGETTTTVKVYGNIYTYEDDNNFVWISEPENTRVIMDKVNKTAIITENPEEALEVESLNSTYLNYFENDNMTFKYLGTEDIFYKLQFADENLGSVTTFYLNKDTGIVEKMVEEFNDAQNTYEISVTKDSVTAEETEYPDLSEYNIGVSSSTVITESSEDYEKEVAEENIVQENN